MCKHVDFLTANKANWTDLKQPVLREMQTVLPTPVGRSQSQPLGNDFEGFFDFVTQQRVPDTGLMESQPRLQHRSWKSRSGCRGCQVMFWMVDDHPHHLLTPPWCISFYHTLSGQHLKILGLKWGDLFLWPVLVLSELNSAEHRYKKRSGEVICQILFRQDSSTWTCQSFMSLLVWVSVVTSSNYKVLDSFMCISSTFQSFPTATLNYL